MRRSRSWLVAASLGLMVGLVLVLAVMAQSRALSHRRSAERVVADYARFAADEAARRVQQRLAYRLNPGLLLLASSGADRGVLLPRAELEARGGELQRAALDLADGVLVLRGDSVLVDGAPAPGLRRRFQTGLPGHDPDWYFAVVWSDSAPPGLLVFTEARRGGPRTAWGLTVPGERLAQVFSEAVTAGPMLPPSLTGGRRLDSLVAVTVRDPRGRSLFASGPVSDTTFLARQTLDAMFGSAVVEVTLDPRLAPRLLIGGIPPSPLPVVLAVLGLTAVLAGLAVRQLGQERQLAGLRSDFVAAASHELRTPLAQIRRFAETLQLGRIRTDEERSRSLAIIGREASRLGHLVDNLTHVARGERNGLRVSCEPVELAQAVRDVVDGFGPLAAARDVTIVVETPGETWARADRGALGQVLLNLLDNAVKYGPAGGRVVVSAAAEGSVARLMVDDQGPGIPPTERERVFARFERLPRDREGPAGGSGIGLAIVRDLVTLMGGQATLEDAPGGGTRAVVRLPAA